MTGVEEANIRQFSRVAHAFDHRLALRFLHETHRIALDGLDLSRKQVLDVAAGTGELAIRARAIGAEVVCADIAKDMMRVARAKGLRTVTAAAGALPFPDGRFDLAVTTNSFHHFPDGARAIAEMGRVVRKGGLVVVQDIALEGILNRVVNAIARTFEPAHVTFVSMTALDGAMREAGLADVRVVLRRGPLGMRLLVGRGAFPRP